MGPTANYLDYIRTFLALIMLTFASYKDVKTREIHDVVWLTFGGAGLILNIYEVLSGFLNLRQLLISVGFMSFLMIVLGYFKLFGEADLLAFIALSLLHPKAPGYLLSRWGWGPPLFVFTLVSNTAIAGVLTPLMIFIRNAMIITGGVKPFKPYPDFPLWRKTVLLFSGVYMEKEKIKGVPFHYPLETSEGRLRLRPDIWNDEKAEQDLINLKNNKKRIWVSITLPYVTVITAGYILSVVFGDIFLWAFILFLQ